MYAMYSNAAYILQPFCIRKFPQHINKLQNNKALLKRGSAKTRSALKGKVRAKFRKQNKKWKSLKSYKYHGHACKWRIDVGGKHENKALFYTYTITYVYAHLKEKTTVMKYS